ncbi:MAG: DUF6159 family protein [Caldilineaceae bacterium]
MAGLPGRLAGPVVRRVVVFSFVGLAWNLITYLVVPILVVENIGPRQAIQRSTALIKKTWGEQVVAYVSTGLLFLVFMALWLGAHRSRASWAVTTLSEPIITATIYVLLMVPPHSVHHQAGGGQHLLHHRSTVTSPRRIWAT